MAINLNKKKKHIRNPIDQISLEHERLSSSKPVLQSRLFQLKQSTFLIAKTLTFLSKYHNKAEI
ncbi:hypothetical protein V1478_018552 [Vespula squamosa]|uniref:Uncharacterized protein n=1 Tax=Vespula squamosa TaxID=30214 RepID=A0ABD1ZTF1_VESSQ